jgi:hypothetical protein
MPKKPSSVISVKSKKKSDFSARDSFKKLFRAKPNYADDRRPIKVAEKHRVHFVNVKDDKIHEFRETFQRDIQPNIDFEFTPNPRLHPDEDGRTFYYAVSPLSSGKYQSFKVFVIPEVPLYEMEYRNNNFLTDDMHDYQLHSAKQGGSADNSEFGARYQFRYVLAKDVENNRPPKPETTYGQTILFKQDIAHKKIRHDKNISEYVASRLMNLFGGDSAATTFLAAKPSGEKIKLPDLTGENIYVGSIYYNNYQDLFQDIERIHGRVPHHDMTRPKAAGSLNKSWFRFGIMNPVTKACRFHNLETIIGIGLLLDDSDDMQSGNIGNTALRVPTPEDPMALVKDPKGKLMEDEFGKIGVLVKIDHANALRDIGDEVHMDTFRFWLAADGNEAFTTQPTNHLREIPTALKVTPSMALELERLGNFDQGKVETEVDDTINEVGKFYGVAPMLKFAERMGMDVKSELHTMFLSNDNYNNIIKGSYIDKKEGKDKIKKMLSASLKAFLTQKMKNRMASMRKVAIDMKVSLCFKLEKGYPVLDKKSPFDLKSILNEHPEYILNDRFHFRSSGQKGIIASLTAPFNKWRLHNMAHETSKSAAIETLKEFLGSSLSKSTNYDVTFYKSEKDRQMHPPIPVGVHHIIISDTIFKNSIYYNKHKKSSPNLSASMSNTFNGLEPGQCSLNFVDTTAPGAKGLYIEQVTETAEYELTAQRLPPELNTRYIYSKVILSHLHLDLLSADPTIARRIERLAGKLFSENGAINDSRLSASEKNYIKEMTERNSMTAVDFKNMLDEMLAAEQKARFQEMIIGDDIYLIPSKAYLDFAEVQCQAMMLRNGPSTIIGVLPEPSLTKGKYNVLDPVLTQAYMMVCEKNNWRFENKTNVPSFTQEFLQTTSKHISEQERNNPVSRSVSVK